MAWFWGRQGVAAGRRVRGRLVRLAGRGTLGEPVARVAGRRPLAEADAQALRLIARRTWRFFEASSRRPTTCCRQTISRKPQSPVVAHRTSPTNIGLYLLSVACARDFGWIGTLEAAERLEATLATMGRLAKHRGHFFNWYDTRELRPLDPQYVSSVDSGNLAGHLIALANACREWRTSATAEQQRIQGVADALDLVAGRGSPVARPAQVPGGVVAAARRGDRTTGVWPAQPSGRAIGIEQQLAELSEQAAILADAVASTALEGSDQAGADLQFWADAVACLHRKSPARSRARLAQPRWRRG